MFKDKKVRESRFTLYVELKQGRRQEQERQRFAYFTTTAHFLDLYVLFFIFLHFTAELMQSTPRNDQFYVVVLY